MSFSVSVDTAKLNQILATLGENRDEAVRACALYVLGEARKKAPVDTGFLRDNSGVNMPEPGLANVMFHAEYAAYQELGTHKMQAHPFLTPACEKGREELVKNIKEGLIK